MMQAEFANANNKNQKRNFTMTTEKTIKLQAKKSLAGNWCNIIAAVVLWCVLLITVDVVGTLSGFLLGVYNGSGELVMTGNKKILLNFIYIGEFVVLVFFSPIINGIFKMFSNVSLYGRTEIYDAFFYFRNSYRYFKACVFNLILASIFMFFNALTRFAYGLLESAVGRSLQEIADFDIISVMLVFAMVAVVVLNILFYLIFVHYQLFTFAYFDNISILMCVFGMYGFAFRHLGSAIKMIFSFIGWILLCFFVVPAFYVLPYMAVSMADSAKWLFAYDKDRGLLC